MKGWIDRVFAPDAAYGFIKGVDQGDVPVGLLATKVALVINTGNTPLDREREAFGDPLERMWRDCILTYCGVGRHACAVRRRGNELRGRAASLADRGSDTGGKGSGAGRIGLGAEVRGHRSALLRAHGHLLAEPRLKTQPALMQQHVEPVDAALAARTRGRQQPCLSGT